MKFIAIPVGASKTQYFINQTYVDYIQEAEFIPILVHQNTINLDYFVSVCDGLLLPGGVDIDPVFYGENNYGSRDTEIEKDMFERSLIYKFVQKSKPILGICRGFQLLMRELLLEFPIDKLEYKQHISSHNAPGSFNVSRKTPHHEVYTNSYKLWNEGKENVFEKRFVNSMHHQGVVIDEKDLIQEEKDKKARKLNVFHEIVEIMAYTDFGTEKTEYLIEAFKATWNGSDILGVQWHPEELNDVVLLHNFFKANKTMSMGE